MPEALVTVKLLCMDRQWQRIHVNEAEAIWKKTKPSGVISSSTAEIWRLHFPSYINSIGGLYEILQPDEKNRSALFHQDKDKQRFIISKGMLRVLLGNYLNIDPEAIRFIYGMYNKPALKTDEKQFIDFNISHSGDYILIAVSDTNIGVDIEYYNPCYEISEVMQLVFSEREISFIKKQSDPYSVFYQLWTRKEALLKALSKGINNDIKSVPCLKGKHFMNDIPLNNTKNWKVSTFKVDEQYTGSIACPANIRKILFKLYD